MGTPFSWELQTLNGFSSQRSVHSRRHSVVNLGGGGVVKHAGVAIHDPVVFLVRLGLLGIGANLQLHYVKMCVKCVLGINYHLRYVNIYV